jgi:hypothetical protein
MEKRMAPSIAPTTLLFCGLILALIIYLTTPLAFPLSALTGLALPFMGAIVWRSVRS